MPKIAIYKYFTFFIFSADALNEPPHIHVVKEKKKRQRSAKIWLESLEVARKGTLSDVELTIALNLLRRNKTLFLNSFKELKNGHKVKTITF
ncbi:MAG: DUF4160 domain-containing protein [Cyclobacteriaceae bacterium]|jgi:hypothetical protein